MNKNVFLSLAKLFNDNGYRLYMVGGTTRDYLLDKEVCDYDFVSDATPEQMKKFLPDANYTFAKYGSVHAKSLGEHVDITTLRIENNYGDSRHPSEICFTNSLEKDYIRRDFTINAIYIDENFNVIDYCGGVTDLKKKIIRFIGEPDKRVKEDPLRILRAKRFAHNLDFEIEEKSLKAIEQNSELLNKLNPQKIQEEMKKISTK